MSSYSTLARTAADQTLRGFLRMVCIHGDMVLGNTHISVHPIISTFSSLTFQVSRQLGSRRNLVVLGPILASQGFVVLLAQIQ